MTDLVNKTRRGFLHLGAAALAVTASSPALAAVPRSKGLRSLAFHNLHTDERLRVTYWQNGKYSRSACAKLDHILRDHYSGDVHSIDVRLLDLLFDLQRKLKSDQAVEIISGYRSPKTNLMLASLSDGVAKQSFHMRGMAIDIRLQGTSLPTLYCSALTMRRGGVGYYPDSEFVHLDVGPSRTWG